MISLFICEGTSDAILYGYYLIKKFNWKYLLSKNRPISLKNIVLRENQDYEIYQKNNKYLIIVSSGGNARFKEIWNTFKPFISSADEKQRIGNIVIVRDRDTFNDDELVKFFAYTIGQDELALNNWNICHFVNDFNENIDISLLPLVIPNDKFGAIETAIIDSLSSNKVYDIIIKESNKFVFDTKKKISEVDKEILKEKRMIPKAILSSFISIVSPTRIFDKVNKILLDYDWQNDSKLNEMLNKLKQI